MRIPYLITIFLVLLASACKTEKGGCPAWLLNKTDDRLTIVNNSSKAITFEFSYEYPQDSNHLEIYVPTPQVIEADPFKNVAPNSSYKYINGGGCWEGYFRVYITSGKLRILIFDVDTVKAYPAAEIIRRGLYKNYLYTLDELKALNWQVVYP